MSVWKTMESVTTNASTSPVPTCANVTLGTQEQQRRAAIAWTSMNVH